MERTLHMKKLVSNSLIMIRFLSFFQSDQFLKIILSAVFMITLLSAGYSQDEECLFRLEEAENLFNTGVFENIPALLE